ncbi:MAG: PRC-barrel domain-containing protein [Bacteroidota bacterium]|nr:PRC-barrel domain-containing protein [Bacteroidota bacterium]
MERNIKSLLGYAMGATDGEIGKVEEFYFDDQSWAIRYLVVKTGSWLFGRSVLISPLALQKPDWSGREFPVDLTKEQVSNSPDIDTHKPVARQHELALYEHYSWQPYRASGYYSGGQWGVIPAAPLFNERILEDGENAAMQKEINDVHLRSTERITGYHIHTTDDEIGHVTDFVIDDETLQILYFVIDTRNWIGGKKVLIPVSDIKEVNWEISKVILDITTDAVRSSKLFIESDFMHMESNKV